MEETPQPAPVELVPEPVAAPELPPEPIVESPEAAVFARVTRLATGFVLALGALVVLIAAVPRLFVPVDLAAGKRWRASSTLSECHPDRIECGGVRTAIFFHTREEPQPWVEFDLTAPTTFRSVSVANRSDGLQERAVPLVLEVSDDRVTWRELARREEPFNGWSPSFDAVTARYVRLRATRTTFLHLEAVKIHP